MNELISIIIPTYKRPGMLDRAIKSCLEQTYKNIEILVIDDNNPDSEGRKETIAFMKKYEDNSQIKYIKCKKNGGGAKARNEGIKNAVGDYVVFLDDDDYFFKDKLEKQLKFMKKHNYDATFTGVETYDETKDKLVKVKRHENFEKYDNILIYHLVEMIVSPQTFMYKREVLENIDGFDNVSAGQEYHLMYKTIMNNFSVGCLHDVLTRICIHSGERITTGKNKLKAEKDLYLLKKRHFDLLTYSQKRQVKYIYRYNVWNKYKSSNSLKQYWWLLKIVVCHPILLFKRKVMA